MTSFSRQFLDHAATDCRLIDAEQFGSVAQIRPSGRGFGGSARDTVDAAAGRRWPAGGAALKKTPTKW